MFDIDNTLADSFHSFNYKYKSRKIRLSSLAVFFRMRLLILNLIEKKENKVIFITSRRFYDYLITKSWLKSIGINIGYLDLVIVDHPDKKYNLIKHFLNKYSIDLYYLDDLSHNHENNDIKFYSVLKKVSMLPIKFFGYSQIRLINDNYSTNNDLNEYYIHNK